MLFSDRRAGIAAMTHVTRGYGLLEKFLAQKRARTANRLIPPALRKARILDIGSGCYPYFLLNTDFAEKYGLDQVFQPDDIERFKQQGVILSNYDIKDNDVLPFDNDYFSVVSMLAVFEHLEVRQLVRIHREIYRVLKPGGIYVMTTPAFWTDRLLRFLASIGLISAVEINEHKGSYRFSDVSRVLRDASFQDNRLEHGYFEVFMNLWVTATK